MSFLIKKKRGIWNVYEKKKFEYLHKVKKEETVRGSQTALEMNRFDTTSVALHGS